MKKEDILIIILVSILIIAIFFSDNIKITGFSVYNKEINLEDLPKIINLNKNSQFSLKINEPGYKFSDNTPLFDITEEGLIEFMPKKEGSFRIVIVALDQDENLKTKVIKFNIQ